MPRLEFFFDLTSPWTYLAFAGIQPLAKKHGIDIEWRPILVGGVFNAVNQSVYTRREAAFSEFDARVQRVHSVGYFFDGIGLGTGRQVVTELCLILHFGDRTAETGMRDSIGRRFDHRREDTPVNR